MGDSAPQELHNHDCRCRKCNENSELEALLGELEFEIAASSAPTPGSFYQIKRNDNLLKVVGKAYGVGEGEERLKLAQMVNNDPSNRKFWRKPNNDFERTYFKEGVISFSPRFTCGEEQTVAKRGEKKCYGRIILPQKTNDPKRLVPVSIQDSVFISSCNSGESNGRLHVQVKKNSSKQKLSLLAKATKIIPIEKAKFIIDLYNLENNNGQIIYSILKENLSEIRFYAELFKNNSFGKMNDNIESYVKIFFEKKFRANREIIYHYNQAQFKGMFEKKANLGICLDSLYIKSRVPKLQMMKPGQFILLLYISIPISIISKAKSKHPSNLAPQEDPAYNPIKKVILPSRFPRDAIEWSKVYSEETEIKRFKNQNQDSGDVIIWKHKGYIQGYQEYPENIEYYKNYVRRKQLLFSYADKDNVAKILHSTYTLWNSDMRFFVEKRKISPSSARDELIKLNREFLETVIKELVFAVLGTAASVGLLKGNVTELIDSLGSFFKWLESKQ